MKTKLTITIWAIVACGLFLALTGGTVKLNGFIEALKTKFQQFQQDQPQDRVYLQLDKTLYKPGETIWLAAHVRGAKTLQPSSKSDIVHVELIGPDGKRQQKHELIADHGIAKGDFQLAPQQVGGLYTLRAYTNWQKNETQPIYFQQEIQVQEVILPKLKMKLDFERESYYPGETAVATLELESNENEVLAEHAFSYTMRAEGDAIRKGKGTTNGKGKALISLDLPPALFSPDVMLNVLIQYQGATESISRPVPVSLDKLQLSFYPEGGDMVVGQKGKVAFKALNVRGKPTEVAGIVKTAAGEIVANFESFHQGMGAFELAPRVGEKYTAEVQMPGGKLLTFVLPEALGEGMQMAVQPHKDHLDVVVNSSEAQTATLVALVRDSIYFATTQALQAGPNRIKVSTDEMPAGVAQLTLFDAAEVPVAERLAFVNKHRQLNITINTDKEKYLPREEVTMTIKVEDETGNPVPADLSLAVVDDQLLSYADDKSSHILSWMLMEADLKGEVHEPRFYFDETEEKADQALDYLLMTQGWRRFVWEEIKDDTQQKPIKYLGERTAVGGIIYNAQTEQALLHATVTDLNSGQKTTVDANGRFEFKRTQDDGPMKLRVEALGFEPQEQEVGAFTTSLSYALFPVNIILPSKPHLKEGEKMGAIDAASGMEPIETSGTPRKEWTTTEPQPFVEEEAEEVVENNAQSMIVFSEDIILEEIEIAADRIPVYDKHNLITLTKMSGAVLEAMPTRDINTAVALTPGVYQTDEGANSISIRGARASGTVYYIDGIKVRGTPNLPQSAISELTVMTGGTPAEFGDFTGGVVSITTKGPDYGAYYSSLPSIEIKERPAVKNIQDVIAQIPYPTEAVEAGIEGEVMVRIWVNEAGNYVRHKVIAKGHPLLYKACKHKLEALKFSPAVTTTGDLYTYWTDVPFRFFLSEKSAEKAMNRADSLAPVRATKQYYRARQFSGPDYADSKTPDMRSDFRSTIYWNGHIKVPATGGVRLRFYCPDNITSFRAVAEGIGDLGNDKGAMAGRGEHVFFTQKPFALSTKIPVELVEGDEWTLPLQLINHSETDITGKLAIALPTNLVPLSQLPQNITVRSGQVRSLPITFRAQVAEGSQRLAIQFDSKGYDDGVSQSIKVIQRGFPASAGIASSQSLDGISIDFSDAVPQSIEASLKVYNSVMEELTGGLEGMLRAPYGCFEQTSSITYPNILALQLMEMTGQADPDIRKTALSMIEKGYRRLENFQTAEGGFEWFGHSPGHEVLTAYGLMEFKDMAAVYAGVNPNMVGEAREWLMNRRNGKGGFHHSGRTFGTVGAREMLAKDLYVLYGLTESGVKHLEQEIAATYEAAMESGLPYQIALAANIQYNVGNVNLGQKALKSIIDRWNPDQGWAHLTSNRSAIGGQGQGVAITTTALSMMAMLKDPHPNLAVLKQMAQNLRTARNPAGYFGNTHSTVLAMRALVAYLEVSGQQSTSGSIRISPSSQPAADFAWKAHDTPVFDMASLTQGMTARQHDFSVSMPSGQFVPYLLTFNWRTTTPVNSSQCLVTLTADLDRQSAKVGETVRLTAQVAAVNEQAKGMAIAIVSIPAGLSVQPWQLKALMDDEKVDYYEIRQNELIFYFRELNPQVPAVIHLDLKAELAGTFESQASSAYMYYTPEHKVWTNLGSLALQAR